MDSESQPLIRQGSMPHGVLALDELDRHIMKLLRHDGRLTYAQIARTVGVSEPTVRKRIDRLTHAGAIMIMARVNPAPIGFPIDAFIAVKAVRGRVKEVGQKLAAMENVAYVAYLAGSFDILIEAFLPDTEGLFKFLNEDLEAHRRHQRHRDVARDAHREVLLQLGRRERRPERRHLSVRRRGLRPGA